MRILSACTADTAEIYRIVAGARSLASDPGWYCTDLEDYIWSHIVNPDVGIVLRVVEHDCLAALFIIHFPGSTPDSLGYYMNLEPEAPDRVVHTGPLTVRSSFRGRGFQYQFMASAEQHLVITSYRYLMEIVHPDSRYSLGNFLRLGYWIVTTTKKYGGLPRYALYKSINNPPSSTGSGGNTASVFIYLE